MSERELRDAMDRLYTAIYPEYDNLARCSFSPRTCLSDATQLISELRQERDELAARVKQLEAAEESRNAGLEAPDQWKYSIRPTLAGFAEAQEQVLRAHDQRRGGWGRCSAQWLLQRLMNEAEELRGAIHSGNATEIKHECCDVANFAMMIFDVSTERGPR